MQCFMMVDEVSVCSGWRAYVRESVVRRSFNRVHVRISHVNTVQGDGIYDRTGPAYRFRYAGNFFLTASYAQAHEARE